jgi:NAD(P)-dependent dehydrogenase (short-subunit alcohol dehydrogenase family)
VELGGKVAVVTGAAMGIGFAVAKALTDAGAQVVATDLDAEAGQQAATELGAHFIRADVAEDDDLARIIETAERFGGGLDILVNNAGGVLQLIQDDSLAGRVLVWFAEEDPYLLPEQPPHGSEMNAES